MMADSGVRGVLRSLPAMEALLNTPWAAAFSRDLDREAVKSILTEALDGVRGEIREGARFDEPPDEVAARRAKDLLARRSSATLRRVVNATGVVIHTNLGRAPLADEAIRAVCGVSGAYSTLEYALEEGGREERGNRGERNDHVEWRICRLTGAEAALVVNNNAAAVLLALSATAAGREVIVSSGELVEIGGSFRIPEILAFSGAAMKAVGCTNVTRIDDFQNAITENTAVLLKVHPSNYRIEGFVKSASREELAALAASRNLVFMEDLGSGLLCDLEAPFARREPTVRECGAGRKAASGIVTFSGDKLLGGPQIGVIAGSKELVDRMKRHQLLRALRVDKMSLAAFDATLRLYLSGRRTEIPVVRMIETDKDALRKKARGLRRLLVAAAGETARNLTISYDCAISIVETRDAVGGGAYPTDALPGFGVEIRSPDEEALAAGLRTARIPVIPAVRDGAVILHVRTLLPGDERVIADAFAEFVRSARSLQEKD
jgi:L-seryl-tRNA(Ser) seleniumtransferase